MLTRLLGSLFCAVAHVFVSGGGLNRQAMATVIRPSRQRVALDHSRAFGPRRGQPDDIAGRDRGDVRGLADIHYYASREAKRSVPAASQSRSAMRKRRTRVTDEQTITSRGCEGRSPCARRGLDGDGLGDLDRDPTKQGGITKCETF